MTMEEASTFFKDLDTDVFSYVGPIEKAGYSELCDALDKNRKKKRGKVLLVLCTRGGDPNAGYRIARALIHEYGADNFRVAVPEECKSAGTLICIGAHALVMFDRGELGPLDVQFQKSDEIFQQSSGLDILRGMTYLKDDALSAFKQYLFDINGGSGLSTKVASEIAGNLVKGIYEPMYSQIDPIRLGEMNAALQIAHEYGSRLTEKSKSLKQGALKKLIHEYPTHGFVIDRAEARQLFERVTSPTEAEVLFGDAVGKLFWNKGRITTPYILNLSDLVESLNTSKEDTHEPNADNAAAPDGHAADPAVVSDAPQAAGAPQAIDVGEQSPS